MRTAAGIYLASYALALSATLALGACLDDSTDDDAGTLAADDSDVEPYAVARLSGPWPSGIVSYVLNPNLTSDDQRAILDAIDEWEDATPYRFRLRTNEPDYVTFLGLGLPICDASDVGRKGGQQFAFASSLCAPGEMIHVLGHIVGLYNEQQHPDRNDHIVVNRNNITSNAQSKFDFLGTFGARYWWDYDAASIMLDNPLTYSRNGLPTMTQRGGAPLSVQRTGLSDRDIASAVNLLAFDSSRVAPLFIKNVNSNQCLSLEKFDNNGRSTKLVQQPCRTGNAVDRWQQWYFYPAAGGSLMINYGSGDCVDVPGSDPTIGTQLQQFSCHGKANQVVQFALASVGFELKMRVNGLCLDVANASNASNAHVNQFTCRGSGNQQWILSTTP